ncbi:amino acid ABC transporter permease [Streptantibioticus rubrisoli]|uniref:Amino acid ABC transporter permease n=1 Tax=Streptantibioticus rubrisoli TaxID=1387313 RepID=A0ABT1PLA5_9ACTN|nr:amino acid ABC transporter permease [Streptantibioticus rubrisoli]MCQ4045060.1 amino acid ABC transporter permease [Streptantibioticus rubrisoli]
MNAGVLFDAPGPKARRRIRIHAVAATAALLTLVGFTVLRLSAKGSAWELFSSPELQQRLADGVLATLKAFALAGVGSLALGALLAAGRLSRCRAVRWAATGVVAFFRALPPLVLVFALYAGALPPLWSLVLGLALHHGCAQAELLRAGIDAVPRGQTEAGYAVGMRGYRVLATVLVPQALRTVLPTVVSQLVVTLKDTSLGYLIGYPELLHVGRLAAANTVASGGHPYAALLTATGALYVALCLALSALARWIERLGARGRG